MIIGLTSGGYDPIHIGHIRQFKAARENCDKHYVLLNSDRFLRDKKGYRFMPFLERMEILKSIKYIDSVIPVIDEDQSVRNTLRMIRLIHPTNEIRFFKGGDSVGGRDREVCKELGIMIWENSGGGKVQSSSWLVNNVVTSK